MKEGAWERVLAPLARAESRKGAGRHASKSRLPTFTKHSVLRPSTVPRSSHPLEKGEVSRWRRPRSVGKPTSSVVGRMRSGAGSVARCASGRSVRRSELIVRWGVVIGKRRRELTQEAGRKARAEVFARLDRLEADAVEYRRLRDVKGQDIARSRFPRKSAQQQADLVGDLTRLCGGDANNLLFLLGEWQEERESAITAAQADEHRYGTIALWAQIAVGNLRGHISEEVPLYRADLAAEGKRRGWRR